MSAPLCSLTLHLPSEAATESLARQLAPMVSGRQGGPAGAHIHLRGDLGAGKTAFTRALLRECGITGRIKSPSYALLESYKVSNLYFYHLDFYRFSDSREWLDAGFRDLLRDDAVVLIEWPERAEGLPPPDLLISLAYAGEGRDATLTAYTARGQTWLNAIVPRPQRRPPLGRRHPAPPDQRRSHPARPAGPAAPGPGRDHPRRADLAGRRIHPGHARTRQRAQGRTIHTGKPPPPGGGHRRADHQRRAERPDLQGAAGRSLHPEPARGAEPPQRGAPGVRPEAARGAAGVHPQARGRLPVPAGAGPVPEDRPGPADRHPEQAERPRRGRPAGAHPRRHPAQPGDPRRSARTAARAGPAARRAPALHAQAAAGHRQPRQAAHADHRAGPGPRRRGPGAIGRSGLREKTWCCASPGA